MHKVMRMVDFLKMAVLNDIAFINIFLRYGKDLCSTDQLFIRGAGGCADIWARMTY